MSDLSEIIQAAKAERLAQLARAAKADADTAETLAEAAALAHLRDVRRWNYETAGDSEDRIFRFSAEVTPSTVAATIDQLGRWQRLDNRDGADDRPYTFYITSGGGAVMPGISLLAALRRIAAQRPLTTVASGFVASMASVLFQAGTTRLIEPGTTLLIHDVSSGAYGDVHSLTDTAAWMARVNHDLHKVLAERSTLTVEEVAERSKRRDWTLTAEEAVELGFADEVVR